MSEYLFSQTLSNLASLLNKINDFHKQGAQNYVIILKTIL